MTDISNEPMTLDVITEISAPIYITLPIVKKADGLSRFQAIDCSSSCLLLSVFSFSSGAHASLHLTLRLDEGR